MSFRSGVADVLRRIARRIDDGNAKAAGEFFELRTKRYRLRPPTERDAAAIQRQRNHETVARHYVGLELPYTLENALHYIRSAEQTWRRGSDFRWVIEQDGTPIGTFEVNDINRTHRRATIAVLIAPEHAGKGACYEVLQYVLAHMFDRLEFRKMIIETLAGNLPMLRVIAKSSFRRAGVLTSHYWKGNEWQDVLTFGLLREEWNEHRRRDPVARETQP